MPARKLGAFLESGINALMPHAERVIELRRAFDGLLPENLRRSCSIANVTQGKVIIFAENAAIAAKLKLMAPTLQTTLAYRRGEVTAIEVRVQQRSTVSAPQKRRDLSGQAAESLRQLGDQLVDSDLKKVVQRLSKRNVSKR